MTYEFARILVPMNWPSGIQQITITHKSGALTNFRENVG